MADPVPRLADLLSGRADPRTPTEITATVQSTRVDGTVNLHVLGATVLAVPADANYTPRKAGDPVVVSVRGRQWRVVGKTGDEARRNLPKPAAVGWGSEEPQGSGWHRGVAWVRETPEQYEVYVQPGKPSEVHWGVGAPSGTGWHSGTTVYARETEDAMQVYLDTDSDQPPPPPPTPPDGGSSPAPDPAKAPVVHANSYRHGSVASYHSMPTQGDWTGRGNLTGCWFYGTRLHEVVSAHDVKSVRVEFVRDGEGGIYGRVPMRLYLHDHATAPKHRPVLHHRMTGPRLARGEGGTFDLPRAAITALAGSARGFAVFADGPGDYATFHAAATVYVTYA